MRVFLDTNILISAALFPRSVPAAAYRKATRMPFRGIISDLSLAEFHRVTEKKFANRIYIMDAFIQDLLKSVKIYSTPTDELIPEMAIRDIADRKIYRAAVAAGADIIVTGDKDLLESGLEWPEIMRPAQFLDL